MADLSGLSVRQLQAFDAIVNAGSFGRAAEHLGYTQGAVSQQILGLERMLGGALFDRPGGPRPAILTPLGQMVAERARQLLDRIDALEEEADRVREGRAGVLGIGSFQSVTAMVLPTVLSRMREQYPHLQFRILPGESDDELLAGLESGQADVAFIAAPAPRLSTQTVLADPWVVLAEPGVFPEGPIDPRVLDGCSLIGQDADTWQHQCELELSTMGVAPDFTFRTSDNAAAAAMVRAGIGSALSPLLATMDHSAGLVVHPLRPDLQPRQIFLARPTDRTIPPSVDTFVALTTEVCGELAEAMPLMG